MSRSCESGMVTVGPQIMSKMQRNFALSESMIVYVILIT